MRPAISTRLHVVREGVNTSVSIDHVTKAPTGLRAVQSSGTAVADAKSEAAITEAATGNGAPVQSSVRTGLVREAEEENVIEKLIGPIQTGIEHALPRLVVWLQGLGGHTRTRRAATASLHSPSLASPSEEATGFGPTETAIAPRIAVSLLGVVAE